MDKRNAQYSSRHRNRLITRHVQQLNEKNIFLETSVADLIPDLEWSFANLNSFIVVIVMTVPQYPRVMNSKLMMMTVDY